MTIIIQSVTRAIRILDALSEHPGGLSNKEIADKVGLNKTTAHHLVGTLEAEDYVYRLNNGKFSLGPAIPRLHGAYMSTNNPQMQLQNAVETLAELTKETAYMCTWNNGGAVIQAIIEGSQAVRVGGLYAGFMGNTHLRASGKVLLAYLDQSVIDEYLATADFNPLTPHSVRSVQGLKKQLGQVVEHGYAIDREEFAEGVNCVSAPVFSAEGKVVASLTISAPTTRFVKSEDFLISTVTQTAANTSKMLGGFTIKNS